MSRMRELLEAAMELSFENRLELAELIELSVPQSYFDQIEKEWAEEIERRCDAIDRGEENTIPGEQVIAELRKKYPPRQQD